MTTQSKRVSKRGGLWDDTGKSGGYVEKFKGNKVIDTFCPGFSSSPVFHFLKVKGLVRKAMIPPPTTHLVEVSQSVSQVTLWQSCKIWQLKRP